MSNHSLFSADRATHLKIVAVPLVAGALFALAALNARSDAAPAGPGAKESATLRIVAKPAPHAAAPVVAFR